MINSTYDANNPYTYLRYGRMSGDEQNPRSPDQQFATIDEVRNRTGPRWRHLQDYRDDAITGRYRRKRPGLQAMLDDIRTGRVKPDLILVDNIDRLGRHDELDQIRRDLHVQYGILVLTADTNFSDPTTPQGRVFGTFDAIRAREENRVKANAVRRGKRDAVQQKRWPGGPPPFGTKLRQVVSHQSGRANTQTFLEWDPEKAWIIQLLFQKAKMEGWGQTQLARFLNDHPDIPDKLKPFHGATIGYWLDNPIYIGELRWDAHATDIIDDVRVVKKNDADVVLSVPDFCDALISRELWNDVQALREARRMRHKRSREHNNSPEKQIQPLVPGMALRYPLSGLVRCGTCGLSMVPSPSPAYVTKSGEERRYTAYFCTADCGNDIRVPEEWLRRTVFDTIRQRLFVNVDPAERQAAVSLLMEEVREELKRLTNDQIDRRPALRRELEVLMEQQKGWSLSLSKPDLHLHVREEIEKQMGAASERQEVIETELSEFDTEESAIAGFLNEPAILERLDRLPDILADQNPTVTNIELSLHIDRIECFADARVILRTCRLGALAPNLERLRSEVSADSEEPCDTETYRATPRRRARRRVDDPIGEESELKAAAEFAADPDRFAGLDEKWFWKDEFQIPERTSWAKAFADEVAGARAKGWTMQHVADHFGKSVPTIREALRHAGNTDGDGNPLPKKMPRQRWHEDHAEEVAALKAKGMTTNELAKHFGESDTTIRKALRHADSS